MFPIACLDGGNTSGTELYSLWTNTAIGTSQRVDNSKAFFMMPPFLFLKVVFLEVSFSMWHAVASWTWDAQDETCGICRMPFDGCCPDCKLPGDDCPLIWGACNHSFHLHCILKWVNSQTSQAHCPMCRREWQFKE
uniref:Anaphase-promoting complex subunit 11 n=1 Tax=Brassica campestris TaxID=3711 RepID=M4D0B4_BRACM